MQLTFDNFEPCLLIATPELQDPNFNRAVVLLMEYQKEGAFGLVLNRPIGSTLEEAKVGNLDIIDLYRDAPIYFGGPVRAQEILCLYEIEGEPITSDGLVAAGLGVTSSKALLVDATERALFPGDYRLLAGHSMWGPKQLEQEIQAGAWFVAPFQRDLIFSREPKGLWVNSIERMGVNLRNFVNMTPTLPN